MSFGYIVSLLVSRIILSLLTLSLSTTFILLSQGAPIGIDSPLVDKEGYPRADIDIYRARTLRKRFKEIQTDHKTLDKQIELGLVEIAALTKDSSGSSRGSCEQTPFLSSGKGNGNAATSNNYNDEEETKARLAPKPKPKFDPKTGKWVVKSWDGSVAGVENGESRSFEDLSATSKGALASIVVGQSSGADNISGGALDNSGRSVVGNNTTTVREQQQQQQQNYVSFLDEQATTPFAIIDEVSPNSPASEAGIKENDALIRFGSVNSTNHRDFRAIAELLPLAASENKSILVAVRRKTSELGGVVELTKTEVLELKPRVWDGRGFLGCHIRPYVDE